MWNVETETEAAQFLFWEYFFEFSVLYLYSAYLIGQREQTKHIATKTYHPKTYHVTCLQNLSAQTPILMKTTPAVRTLQRQSRLYISFLGIVRPQPQFPHSCVCERFIYSQDRSTYFLQQKKQTHRGNI
jgi:hypothetical protein